PVVSPPPSTIGDDKSSSPALPSTPPSGHDKSGLHDERVKPGSPALSPPQPTGRERIEKRSASSTQGSYDRGKASAASPQNTVHVEAGMTAGHTVLTLLSADVTAVPGVGASVAAKLHNLGIRTVRDLLFYFPREHRD